MKVKIILVLILVTANAFPFPEVENDESKGIIDTLAGTTTTAKPGGIGALPGLNNLAQTGPILVLGGFQAIVTKFDPSLIQGLPGLSGLPQIG
jgi:hypothetical protein